MRDVRVALPGEPPERAGRAGYGVDPVRDRGVRAELGPERPDGLAGHRLGSLHEQLLVPALPLFAEAEEKMFRLGAERRSRWGRFRRSVEFGLAHALIGIPIGAALGLSVGGMYFTSRYLRTYRRTSDTETAMAESTRAHLGYNVTVIVIVAVALTLGL